MPDWIFDFYEYLHRKHPRLVSRPVKIGSVTLESLCVQYLKYNYVKKRIWNNNPIFDFERVATTLL